MIGVVVVAASVAFTCGSDGGGVDSGAVVSSVGELKLRKEVSCMDGA